MRAAVISGIALVALLIAVSTVTFTLNEMEIAVVTQLGRAIEPAVTQSGLYLKWPFPFQKVRRFDKRLLEYDSKPSQILTRDKKFLIVDNYAKWRIVDPLRFMVTVRTEGSAQARLDDVIFSVLREELGSHDLSEVISSDREPIMRAVTAQANAVAAAYGIEIRDVRIKRADLPSENERYVFDRMRAERKRQANQYRSEGEEEALKIRANTDLERATILAEAYEQAERIRGEGDAEAAGIYAEAYERAPKFYKYMRTLQAYEATLDEKTTVILSPSSGFLQYLYSDQAP
jgi:membrane protease subunit HflC